MISSRLLLFNSGFLDDFQFLPQLGLREHLALVGERDPSAMRNAADRLKRTRQRPVLESARVEIDIRRLARCSTVQAMAGLSEQIGTHQSQYSNAGFLLRLKAMSKDIAIALEQSCTYAQRLMLTDVANRLLSFPESTRGGEGARFSAIAEAWHFILSNHLEKLKAASVERQEIENPYVVGVPLNRHQQVFVGRHDIAARIEQLILSGARSPLLLYGQRRVGKTSLLYNLSRLLPSSILPMFIDLQGPASKARNNAGFLYNLARGMIHY